MEDKVIQNIIHLGVILVLVIILLVTLIFTGILGCNIVPTGCDIYYSVLKGGAPSILIAYGEGGLGDHVKLENVLNDRDILNAKVRSIEIEKLSYGNINDYDMIIVEEARQICSGKLKVFESFVNSGGRLVWTGDAGTELCPGDSFLLENEREGGDSEKIIGPWARRDFDKQLSFDKFLGINYKGNYCELVKCDLTTETGRIEITNDKHKLTLGISPSLTYKGDFAVVDDTGNSRIVAVLDYGTEFIGESNGQQWLEQEKKYNFGQRLPFIVTSGVGERTAYYAVPIESFGKQDQQYKALIEQMYYGLLYK
ncbi:MAG: hypothetical protein COV47_02745 [Candidatus Diapherotrites archaeon CG11_big_fil_rev_8_21_14_0_20_37_9]|nr:MAG: hypothetical protein COV47_02745 [Candidatus Diapherotrites archaeon CG11_big_fil_rev_8_21_14_0_20_37_9]